MTDEKSQPRRRQWWRIEGERMLLNAEATARFFGVTSRALQDWVNRGCPKEERGWYDPAAIMRWRSGDGEAPEVGKSLEARKLRADTLYREHKAERERIQTEAAKGMYLERAIAESEWAGRIVELKAGLLAMTRKVAASFADAAIRRQVERVINDEVYSLLDQYARTGTYTPTARTKGSKENAKAGRS